MENKEKDYIEFVCPHCKGKGDVPTITPFGDTRYYDCKYCKGTGKMRFEKVVKEDGRIEKDVR